MDSIARRRPASIDEFASDGGAVWFLAIITSTIRLNVVAGNDVRYVGVGSYEHWAMKSAVPYDRFRERQLMDSLRLLVEELGELSGQTQTDIRRH